MQVVVRGPEVDELELLRQRISERLVAKRLSARAAALKARNSASYVNDILEKKSKNPDRTKLAKLAAVLDCDVEYLTGESNVVRVSPALPQSVVVDFPGRQRPFQDLIPLISAGLPLPGARFNFKGRHLQTEPIPSIRNVSNAYAVTVLDEANAPRFSPGEVVHVNPMAAVSIGCFVVCQLPNDTAMIRRLDGLSDDSVILATLKNQEAEAFDRQSILSIHRIVAVVDL